MSDELAESVAREWEVYKDAAAFEEHKNADFMADFRDFSAPLIKNRVLATGDQIA
jgi:quinol monooxygenase YgiN